MPKIDWVPGTGRRGRPIRKVLGIDQRQGLILMGGLAAVMIVLAGFAALGGFNGTAAASSQSSGGAASSGGDAAKQDGPGGPGTTPVPADPAKAAKLLQDSTQHYADLFAQGQKIVGHTRYADQKAYGQAFVEAKSPAALFAAYRTKPNPEADATYSDAFTAARKAFGSKSPPATLGTWSADMVKVKTGLSAWVDTAVQYQSSAVGQADLDAAAAKVTADLAAAKADAAAVGG